MFIIKIFTWTIWIIFIRFILIHHLIILKKRNFSMFAYKYNYLTNSSFGLFPFFPSPYSSCIISLSSFKLLLFNNISQKLYSTTQFLYNHRHLSQIKPSFGNREGYNRALMKMRSKFIVTERLPFSVSRLPQQIQFFFEFIFHTRWN